MKVALFAIVAAHAALGTVEAKLGASIASDYDDADIEENLYLERLVQEVTSLSGLTPSPSPRPTLAPSPEPSAAPTEVCIAEVLLDCSYGGTPVNASGALPCNEISPVRQAYCFCPECVREVVFMYTGNACNGLEGCTDASIDGPGETADISFSPCGSDYVAYENVVSIGDMVTISLDDTCLPECMDVTIRDTVTGNQTQTFTIDTSCDARDIFLKDSYGATDFVGYSCDESDVNNCFQPVLYEVDACNAGGSNLTVYDLTFYFNGEPTDLLDGNATDLESGECYGLSINKVVDRCTESVYFANATMNATNPESGPPCEQKAEIEFSIVPFPLPPTPAPSPLPTLPPSPFPTSTSKPPTNGSCNLDVEVVPECPVLECGWDRCRERPFRMEFRVSPRSCAESDLLRCPGDDPESCTCIRNVTLPQDDWEDQKFYCIDIEGGPAEFLENEYYVIAYADKDPELVYFEGPVSSGGRFNATDPSLEKVEANMFLELYRYSNGTQGDLLQQVLFHSSCSQELYLLDVFGSFQLVEFESTSQLIGYAINPPGVFFNLALQIESDELALEFLSYVVLSVDDGLLPPQNEQFDVSGVVLPPAYNATVDIMLIPDKEFTVITTLGGELNGAECYEVVQSTIICDGTVEPDLSRWATISPTTLPPSN